MFARFLGLSALACLLHPLPAMAQDSCKDALLEGTRQNSSIFQNDYVRQFLIRKLEAASASSRASGDNTSGSLGYGDIKLKLARNESLSESQSSMLKSFLLNDFESDNSYRMLVSSGDVKILDSWLQCMSKSEGLVAYFDNISADGAVLYVRWERGRNPDSPPLVRLIRDIVFPNWVRPIDDGHSGRCWKAPEPKGRKRDGEISTVGCNIALEFLEPQKTFLNELPVPVSADKGSAVAVLPARASYQIDPKVVDVAADLATAPTGKSQSVELSKGIILPSDLASQGYRYVQNSFLGISSEQITGTHRKWFTRCYPARADVTDFVVRLTAKVANEAHISIKCRVGGTIEIARLIAVPSMRPGVRLGASAISVHEGDDRTSRSIASRFAALSGLIGGLVGLILGGGAVYAFMTTRHRRRTRV